MTIDSETVEYIEENFDPSDYDTYQEFLDDILSSFDGRYVRSTGFRPFLRDFYQRGAESAQLERVQRRIKTLERRIRELSKRSREFKFKSRRLQRLRKKRSK